MTILTVNCGSSSVRLDLFDAAARQRMAAHRVEGTEVVAALRDFVAKASAPIGVAVHRVVHGGERHRGTIRLDAAAEAQLAAVVALAPLHNAPALAGIRAAREVLGGGVPQLAVFDSAFFAALPESARTYALPRELARRHGLRRFGFHGLAHRSMWLRLAAWRPDLAASGRVVTFQLGSGCSVAAIAGGAPLDTSMGFTPLEGLVMATRAGDLDPGLLTYLQRQERLSAEEVEDLLYRRCGLAGLAGETSVSRLLARSDEDARLAIDVYCHRARRHLGACLAVLGGADAVVFGGGVGENVPAIRARILEGMAWAGVRLDDQANAAPGTDGRIGASDSQVDVRVAAVDEAALMAEEAVSMGTA